MGELVPLFQEMLDRFIEPAPCRHGRRGECPFCTAPFVHHSQTSQDAAFSIKPESPRARVLAAITANPGITDEGISTLLAMNPSTSRPRRIELANAGLIESRGTAPTASGRHAQCWYATPSKPVA